METRRQDRKAIAVSFTTAPSTVPMGTSTAFVFTVTGPGSMLNRATSFAVIPGVIIDSTTNGTGTVIAAGATTATGQTDGAGEVTVMVTIRFPSNATIKGTDTASGASDTAFFTGV